MIKFISLVNISLAAMAQSVERRIGSAEVTGPIPVSSCKRRNWKPLFIRVSSFLLPKTLITLFT